MDAPTKNSRWDRKPRLVNGKPAVRRVTPTVIEVLKLLHRFRYLQSNDIHAWVGGHYDNIRKLLNGINDEPYCWVDRPHQQRENADANYTHLVYSLDTAGATILEQIGMPEWERKRHDNFIHELMLNRIMFSLHLGLRTADARFISWEDMCAKMPQYTLDSKYPAQLPYEFTLKDGEVVKANLAADGMPFGISTESGYFFAPGIEADNHTEPLRAEDYKRSSWKKKFMGYLDIIESETYRKRWGVPSFYVPCFFPTVSRKNSVMRLLGEMTAKTPKLRMHFLFKVFPTLTTFGGQAPATGHVFTEAFERVEYEPLKLSGEEVV